MVNTCYKYLLFSHSGMPLQPSDQLPDTVTHSAIDICLDSFYIVVPLFLYSSPKSSCMKKMIFLLATVLLFSFSTADTSLTKEERKLAADFLSDTKNEIRDAVKGLSQAQLQFRPAADKWSVEDCLKHIAMSEQMLWGMVAGNLKQPATPEKRSEVKFKDEDVIKNVEDRTNKVKTFAPLEPVNTPFKTAEEAMASFRENRDKLIDYVNTTNDDLRNHINQLPVGVYDSFQMLLFIGAHSNRHMKQINEVKADPNFPKN
jgi:uncharacterized damage-inducible protein DinB